MAGEINTPENVTASDRLGLKDSYKIGFPDVIRLGFSRADNVVLGDTGHDHYREIWGEVAKPENQIAVAESGGAHIFLELPHYRQGLVDQFQRRAVNPDRELDIESFADRFENQGDYDNNIDFWKFNPEEATQDLLKNVVAPILVQASKLDIDVHMMEHGNGIDDRTRAEYVAEDIYNVNQEIDRIRAEQDIESPRVKERLEHLERRVTEELDPDFQELRAKYFEKRHDDRNTARFVNNVSDDQKSLVLFGASHGSRHNDFEDLLKGGAIKIDVALSREIYETEFAGRMESLRTQSLNSTYGEDPADLVYFLDEGVLSTTTSTSPELENLIKLQAQPIKIDVPQAPDSITLPDDAAIKP